MEDNLRMGSKKKKSGVKKKKSFGKSFKSEAAPTSWGSKKGKGEEKSSKDEVVMKGKSVKAETWERQLRPRKLPKAFEDVRIGEGDASRVIGRRLRVYWPLDNKWYSGLVKSFDVKKKRHHVVYDDGDEEWLELKKERVKILVAPGEFFGDKSKENECEVNPPKQKESSSSSGDGNKSGVKRKRHSVADIGKKNDGRRKEAKEEKQESAQKNKVEEDETGDGETMEGNASTNKVMGSVENEALQTKEDVTENKDSHENENKDSHENENEFDGKNSKKVKSSRRTAPRTKRGASARRSQVKPITEHDSEVAPVKQHRIGHSEPDIKLEEGSKATGNANLEDIIVPEVESIPNDDDDEMKQQKAKESGLLCEKKADSSVTETDIADDMDAKGSMKDEKLDESATVAEQLEEQQKDDAVKQGNEDEDQSSEKLLDVTVGDEKATEKQGDAKDADQLSKKHNKKHRGKVKPRH